MSESRSDSVGTEEALGAESTIRESIAEQISLGTPRVLVVDDETQILKAVRRLLSTIDCDVETATNGSDAIDVLDEKEIAVLISDQRMPGLSGVALLNYAMSNHPDTVRIMLTGNSDWSTAVEAINLGQVFRFIAKPWEHDKFVQVIEDSLEQFELRKAKEQYEAHIERHNAALQELNHELEARVEARTREVRAKKEEIQRLYGELEDSFDSTIKSLLSLLEIGDIGIAEHCRRTARRAEQFANMLGFEQERVRNIERAALLHWVGLISAPEKMLFKSDEQYDAEELATWEFHPILGKQAIAHIPALEYPGRIIQYYLRRHDDPTFEPSERLDEELIEDSHVLNICSTFERTRTREKRRENDDIATQKALDRITDARGTEFPPYLVDAFDKMLSEGAADASEVLVELDELEPEMVLSRPIQTAQGVPVAPRDVVITEDLIRRLERFASSKGLGPIWVHPDRGAE
jgi:response regulator RpfG family c-di-GMP phosphodiesterase